MRVRFSCHTFGGFETEIECKNVVCMRDVIELSKEKIKTELRVLRFNELIETIDNINYHVHGLDLCNMSDDNQEQVLICSICY